MQKKDRREYQRIKVGAISQFLIQSDKLSQMDFAGIIDNISEEGIGVVISEARYFPIVESLAIDDEFYFQAFDEYYLYKETVADIFQGKVKVVRIDRREDSFYLGCRVISHNKDYQDYVEKRKVSFFISGLKPAE